MAVVEGARRARGLRFALVVSRYHDFVTDRLQAGALECLSSAEVAEEDITVLRVPGAFEIPLAARKAAETGRFSAIICLGCLIKGATSHFEYLASAVSHAVAAAAADTGVPMTFGVLTTSSIEEALQRAGNGSANKGWEAAMAAVEMATLLKQFARSTSPGIRV